MSKVETLLKSILRTTGIVAPMLFLNLRPLIDIDMYLSLKS